MEIQQAMRRTTRESVHTTNSLTSVKYIQARLFSSTHGRT